MNPQGSAGWFEDRAGKMTASEFHKILRAGTKGRATIADKIRRERAGERFPGFTSAATSWGTRYEPMAIAQYELNLLEQGFMVDVEPCGFIQHPDFDFIGGSPDGKILPRGGTETKCPYNQANHVLTLIDGMPDKHMAQCQGNIWINFWDWIDFISFDPREEDPKKRLYIERIHRDDQYIDNMKNDLLEFWDRYIVNEFVPESVDLLTTKLPF